MITRRDKHVKLMNPVVEHYKKLGHRCIIVHRPTPDFLAINKSGKITAVEVNAYGTDFDFSKFQNKDGFDADEIHWILINRDGNFKRVHDNYYKFPQRPQRPRCAWCGKWLEYNESTRVWKCHPCDRDLITQKRQQHRKNWSIPV